MGPWREFFYRFGTFLQLLPLTLEHSANSGEFFTAGGNLAERVEIESNHKVFDTFFVTLFYNFFELF